MKKLLWPVLAAVFLFASCAGATPGAGPGPDPETAARETAVDLETASIPNAELSLRTADFDLTALGTQMAYVQLSNMMLYPEDYVGKTVKLRGTFAHAAEGEKEFFVCYLMDETACCSQSLEFQTDENYPFPEAYPPEQSEITVYGVFDTYDYNGYEMFRLLHAEIMYGQ
ncbi:MAG: hypothetical protein IJK98_07625 [Clostridia bacterium]|nr:hypothetical protein [Clostridia bacterium]